MEQRSIFAFLSTKSSKTEEVVVIEDESGSESGGECPERPGNSVSGVVGRSLSSGAASVSGVAGRSLSSGAASAPRDIGSTSASCTSVVLYSDSEVELVEPSPPSVSPATGSEDPSLASDSDSSSSDLEVVESEDGDGNSDPLSGLIDGGPPSKKARPCSSQGHHRLSGLNPAWHKQHPWLLYIQQPGKGYVLSALHEIWEAT